MTGLSPRAARAVAVGLLVLALLLAAELVSTIVSGTGEALARLDDARAREARLDAVQASPAAPPAAPIPGGIAVEAPAHDAAAAQVVAAIEAAAAGEEIAVASAVAAPQDPANPNLIRIELLAEGPEEKLLRFVAGVERGPPAVRLRAWRIARSDGDPALLRLQGSALAAWGGPPR